jgi:hypothetical protein
MSKKFPSLFRLPVNKQFDIKPRHYDPIKEDIAERTKRIELELRGEISGNSKRGGITFERRTQSVPNASFLQLAMAAGLGLLFVGWLFYGNQILYLGWLAVPIYLYFRFRKPKSKR